MATTENGLLSSLLSKTSLDDHEQHLRASENALKASKTDLQAQIVKAVALIKLDRYEDAVSFFELAGTALKEKAPLEFAYALYKAGKLNEAAEQASKLSQDRGAQHVEAQARYRLEDFERTAQLYETIRTGQDSAEEYDLRVNQGAIDAQGQWLGFLDAGSARKPGREDFSAFETAYNAACGSIARGELSQAEVLLKRAKTLCQHSEELSDEQKVEELLPIAVQHHYVLYLLGKSDEIETVAQEINIDNIVDASTKKVASNNLLLNPALSSNPFMAYKALHSTPSIPESDKLFSYQAIPLSSNEKTVELNSFKFNGVTTSTRQRLAKAAPSPAAPEALLLSSFNAASLAGNRVGRAAINKLLPQLRQSPTDIGLIFTLVQLYVHAGDTTSAAKLVESLAKQLENSTTDHEKELRYHPALVSMITALWKLQGRKGQVKQELARAASYWSQRPRSPTTLLRAAGVSLLESFTESDIKVASDIFDKLYQEQPKDEATIAGFVASHALHDPDSVRVLAEKLTPMSKLVSDVDVNALEAAGIPQASNALAIAQAGISRKRPAPGGADVGEKKRVRKSRLPKDHDPASTAKPDPERWLPLRDRSYYRPPKGRKKGKRGDDRTQGGVVSEDLDVSKQPQKGAEVVSSGGGGAKKKKGKGKK